MVYKRASSSRGVTSSRISFRAIGVMSAICCVSFSSITIELSADDALNYRAEDVIKEADDESHRDGDADDNERVRDSRPIRRPYDMRELFTNMLQIGEW